MHHKSLEKEGKQTHRHRVRERPGLVWIWRGETTINTYISLNPFETVWPDILLFFFLKDQITED